MNCQRFEDFVDDIAREQVIEVDAREEALEHSRECERCDERLNDERRLTLLLRGFAVSEESAAPERVEARLLAAFEERALLKPRQLPMLGLRSRIAAVAAMLLIAAGLFGIRWRLAVPVAPEANSLAVEKTGPPANGAISSTSTSALIPNRQDQTATLQRRRRPISRPNSRDESLANIKSANDDNREIATDFIPVNYGGWANLEEGGRMVRVELPRSAMANFGLPVNMDRANERVKADVLFGVDGLAHAIRFVR